MAIWKRTDNWLAGIASADHPNHTITEIADLTPEMVQAAFDATYGERKFKAGDHGTVITVWSNSGYVAHHRARAERYRARGDLVKAAEIDTKADTAEKNPPFMN